MPYTDNAIHKKKNRYSINFFLIDQKIILPTIPFFLVNFIKAKCRARSLWHKQNSQLIKLSIIIFRGS